MFKKKRASDLEEMEQALGDVLDGSSLETIYPFSFEECADHIESGDNFIRVLAIIDYPKSRYGNWLSELKRKKGNITIVQFLESSNATKMVDHYNKTIKNKQAEVLKTFDPLKKRQLEKQVEAAEYQLMKFLENESSYIYQYTYIYLQATSLEELNALSDAVYNTLVKLQLKAMTPMKAMYQTFWSAMPVLENLLGDYTYKQSNTEAASSMFPFDDAEILTITPRSDVEGVNKDTGSLIAIDYLDRKNTLNQNLVVIGTSGVGKTTYMMQKILRYVARGVKVFIIDPENEYTNIVEHLGGTAVHLSSNSTTKINPLEVFSEHVSDETDADLDVVLKDKIQRLLGFFQVLKQDITQVEKAILDGVLRQVYEDSGVLQYSQFRDIPSHAYPILKDVYDAITLLKEMDADRYSRIEDFHYILESYVNGSKTIFNGHTNINLHSELVSFDLKPLQNEAEVQGAAYLNTFSYLWDNITENTDENIKLFVDEFHFLTQNPDAASFFYQAFKRFRKYNAGAIAGTQQIQDVLDGKMANGQNVGEAIIGNSYTKVFFGIDNKGVDDLTEKLRITFSEKEKKLLERRKQGEALIIHGTRRAFMRVELTEEELRLKDPEQYEALYEAPHDVMPNYEERIRMTELERQEALQLGKYQK